MDYQKFKKAKAIEKKNKERLLKVNPKLNEDSGIYFLTRIDENGFKYAYIGQAVHLITRLSQHLVGYQHIDLSLAYTMPKQISMDGKSDLCFTRIPSWIVRNSTG